MLQVTDEKMNLGEDKKKLITPTDFRWKIKGYVNLRYFDASIVFHNYKRKI